ncbi:C40 family peptidase [Jatrophihabitans sp. YIM 134969]
MASLIHLLDLPARLTRTDSGRSRRPRRTVAVPAAVAAVGLAVTVLATPAGADPTPTPSTSSSTTATPTLASVTAELTDLARQNEALTEKFNAATIDLTAKQKAATAAAAASTRAQAAYQTSLREYGATIVVQYQTGRLSRTGALLTSTNTQSYLDTMSDLATVSRHNSEVVDALTATKAHAAAAQAASAEAVTAATQVRDALAAQKKTIETRTAKYKSLLTSLTPVQQVTYRNRDSAPAAAAPATLSVHAGSAAAQIAIDFALAQRGKPYVYATSGPNSYDCSGLTAAAYAAAGVSLPHQSAEQYNYGTHVPLSEMQPGDLVFFYSPISHVAIYLGNGLIVHAPTSGDVVKVSPLFAGAVGATRLT